ncbi:MAG: hypothetical protein ACM3MG_11495 [Bacillota bacterium]
MKLFVLFLMPFLVVACASKEKTEVKNPLEYLNGKTYGVQGEAPAGQAEGVWKGPSGIPVAGVKNQMTRVRGALMLGSGISSTPLKFTLVRLVDENAKTVAEATSDLQGRFVLSGVISNGHYVARVISQKFSGEVKVFVDRYDINVAIPVVENNSSK